MVLTLLGKMKIMRKTLDIPKIRKSLEEQQETLIQRLKEYAEKSNRADNPTRADLAMRAIQSERQGLLIARAEEQLMDVQAALNRIEQGTYGLCEKCGKAIHPERLNVIPTTTACMECKRAL